jgi:phage FluMu gp28-like protein
LSDEQHKEEQEEEETLRLLSELVDDPILFCEAALGFKPFPYQAEFLADQSKRIVVCAGRQVGKSTIASAKAIWFALCHADTQTLIVSATLRQSMLMFQKISEFVFSSQILKRSLSYATKTLIRFRSGSRITALPCGQTGYSLRGYTSHLCIMDEAAFMPERVITEVILPMLSTTQGSAIMLSTPFDKSHIFYKAFTSPNWTKFHFPSSANPKIDKDFLEEQRLLVGETRFRQEYLAEFVDDERAYFPMALLRSCVHVCSDSVKSSCSYCELYSNEKALAERPQREQGISYYAGYDPGGKQDPSALVVVEKANTIGTNSSKSKPILRVVLCKNRLAAKSDENMYTRFTVEISELHKKFHFRKLLVDKTGLGQPIVEHCKSLGLPVEGIAMTVKSKEELFSTLRICLEQNAIVLPNDLNLLANLNCIESDTTASGSYTFSHPQGTHDDLGFALALAVWGANKSAANVVIMKQEE